jgi:hypothetical protein
VLVFCDSSVGTEADRNSIVEDIFFYLDLFVSLDYSTLHMAMVGKGSYAMLQNRRIKNLYTAHAKCQI